MRFLEDHTDREVQQILGDLKTIKRLGDTRCHQISSPTQLKQENLTERKKWK
jgi:hypothetical protein